MATLQFIRVDLGEKPAEGGYTKYVEAWTDYHDEICDYRPCAERRGE